MDQRRVDQYQQELQQKTDEAKKKIKEAEENFSRLIEEEKNSSAQENRA